MNIRISQDKTGFFVNRDTTYPDLEALIVDLKNTLFLESACQGSRFQRIFEGADEDDFTGYEVLTEAPIATSKGKGRK